MKKFPIRNAAIVVVAILAAVAGAKNVKADELVSEAAVGDRHCAAALANIAADVSIDPSVRVEYRPGGLSVYGARAGFNVNCINHTIRVERITAIRTASK